MSVGSIFFLRSLQSLTAPVLIVSNLERSSNKNTSLSLFPFSTLPHQGRRSLYTGHNQAARGLVLSEYSQPQDQGLHGPCLFQRGGSWQKNKVGSKKMLSGWSLSKMTWGRWQIFHPSPLSSPWSVVGCPSRSSSCATWSTLAPSRPTARETSCPQVGRRP